MIEAEDRVIALVREAAPSRPGAGPELTQEQFAELRLDKLGLDSLARMELVMQIEDNLGVSLDEEDIIACVTVSDLARLAKRSA